jgi:hypothetical protein
MAIGFRRDGHGATQLARGLEYRHEIARHLVVNDKIICITSADNDNYGVSSVCTLSKEEQLTDGLEPRNFPIDAYFRFGAGRTTGPASHVDNVTWSGLYLKAISTRRYLGFHRGPSKIHCHFPSSALGEGGIL